MVTIPETEPYIQPLNKTWYEPYVKKVAMLRLDVIHPVVSGNKWYKLRENISHVVRNGYKGILTFGGAYSNHLVAAAATSNAFGLASTGIVRGTYATENLTGTLQACKDYGMRLVFISREEYARKRDEEWLMQLQAEHPGYFIVPEGGANEWGREGAKDIAGYIPGEYTHVCISMGTGTSFIGIRNALPATVTACGYAPMKGGKYLQQEIAQHLTKQNHEIFDDWHRGGFGKWNTELVDFMNDFYRLNRIPLDIVYTAKMMFGIRSQLQSVFFPQDASILCIHTGGLQGNAVVQELLCY